MKKYFLISHFCFFLFKSLTLSGQGLPVVSCKPNEISNAEFSKGKELRLVLDKLVREGVPGTSIAVYSSEGWWTGSAGFAKIEDQTLMQACHLQYTQSVSKLYLAVGILKLVEQGKIELDAPISNYLPKKYFHYITDIEKITVRMLMNHTSGIPEYNSVAAYITELLQHPDHTYSQEDYLKYIKGKPLTFVPGSKYSYRNTNYVILSLIADGITGDHAKFLTDVIFEPLKLKNTFYRSESEYLTYPTLVNSYWDRHSDGVVENASVLQRNNVASLYGDDGIVATPEDVVKFVRGLMEGKLITMSTLEIMKSWVKDKKGDFTYGLGLDYYLVNGQPGFGHSGGGIGAGCQLYYFPNKNIYVFIAINLGTVTESPLQVAVAKSLDKMYEILLR
jgi:D-alanyl-D-alanine carboxypeptidase